MYDMYPISCLSAFSPTAAMVVTNLFPTLVTHFIIKDNNTITLLCRTNKMSSGLTIALSELER